MCDQCTGRRSDLAYGATMLVAEVEPQALKVLLLFVVLFLLKVGLGFQGWGT